MLGEVQVMTEWEQLGQTYNSGKFKSLESDLEKFIREHKSAIKDFQANELLRLKNIQPIDELAIRLYIMKTRSINPLEEIKLELDEIEKEIRYQAEKNGGKVDREQVAYEWSRYRAPGWRDHWILSALYVFERCKQKYLKIFNESWTTISLPDQVHL